MAQAPATVGGQAVMEGVMIRDRERLAIAVRKPDGSILLELRPWFTLTRWSWLRKPFVRGFPVLMETLVNGVKALNFSAEVAGEAPAGEGGEAGVGEIKPWHLVLTLAAAIGLALFLFVVLPHLMALGLGVLGWSGDTDSLSFHVWDGVFKMAVFLGYLGAVSLVPDIRRVFQYHGAEHKAIWAYEQGGELTPEGARSYSRLHPRCGTAFLLFVLTISILLHAVLIPGLTALWAPSGAALRQTYIVAVKFLLMIPVSALAYELIRYAGRKTETLLCRILCWPGLLMQRLTTFEPDDSQLEVAIVALKGATADRK
ncbi:MAG: DUF1385 domain-containing protein [Thermodesulfobacteriota bacterium]